MRQFEKKSTTAARRLWRRQGGARWQHPQVFLAAQRRRRQEGSGQVHAPGNEAGSRKKRLGGLWIWIGVKYQKSCHQLRPTLCAWTDPPSGSGSGWTIPISTDLGTCCPTDVQGFSSMIPLKLLGISLGDMFQYMSRPSAESRRRNGHASASLSIRRSFRKNHTAAAFPETSGDCRDSWQEKLDDTDLY